MIEKVIIPECVKVIELHMFSGCTNLKTVVAHDKVEEIGDKAFCDCDKLETIDFGLGECVENTIAFPPSLNKLGHNMFSNNRRIEKIIIPQSVKEIEMCAFDNCKNLKTVVAHDKIEEIGTGAFCGCDKLETIDFGMGKCPVHTVKFPANIKKIGWGAFTTTHIFPKSIFRNVMLSKHTDIYDTSFFLLRTHRGRNPNVAFGNNCTITYYDK